MPNNLSVNKGTEDSLLYDSRASLFQRQGYTRASNFQVELVDTFGDGSTTAGFGRTAYYHVPRIGDLLGPVDLVIDIPPPVQEGHKDITSAWVESLGYAMIERAELRLGNELVETLYGETMNVKNELMRSNADRLHPQILNTGGPAIPMTQRSGVFDLTHVPAVGDPPARWSLMYGTPTGEMDLSMYQEVELVLVHGVTDDTKYLPAGTKLYLSADRSKVWLDGEGEASSPELTSAVTPKPKVRINPASEQHCDLITTLPASTPNLMGYENAEANARIIMSGVGATTGYTASTKHLVIPLDFFFTTKPSDYMPMNALPADALIEIRVHFRPLHDLVLYKPTLTWLDLTTEAPELPIKARVLMPNTFGPASCLRTHQVHLQGAEANSLASADLSRLMTLWTPPHACTVNHAVHTYGVDQLTGKPHWDPAKNTQKLTINLPFLHPVKELIITIRKRSECAPRTATPSHFARFGSDLNHPLAARNYFGYCGANRVSNMDSLCNSVIHAHGMAASWIDLKTVQLKINGRNCHSTGDYGRIDRSYLQERLMQMQHSNSTTDYWRAVDKHVDVSENESSHDLQMLAGSLDRKDIFTFPIAMYPEDHNPSGAINMSRCSVKQLELTFAAWNNVSKPNDFLVDDYQFDVYAQYCNWLDFKNLSASLVFS